MRDVANVSFALKEKHLYPDAQLDGDCRHPTPVDDCSLAYERLRERRSTVISIERSTFFKVTYS